MEHDLTFRPRRLLAASLALAAAVAASPAWAYDPLPSPAMNAPRPQIVDRASSDDAKERSFFVDLGAVAALPLHTGGQLTVELPARILLQGEVGWLPKAYVEMIDGVLVSAGAYDTATSALIRGAISDALVVRGSAGVRPFKLLGLEVYGGYTYISASGGVSARDTIQALTGHQPPPQVPDAAVPVRSTLHNFHVTLGWRWVIANHLVVRATLTYLQCVGSSTGTELASSDAQTQAWINAANRRIDTYLNNTYTTYVKAPVLGLSLAYRF